MRASRTRVKAMAILFGLALGLTLAPGMDRGSLAQSPGDAQANDTMLDGTRWQALLVSETALTGDDGVTIAFSEGRVTGRSGCNRFMGGYEAGELSADAMAAPLMLGPLAGTRMACPGRADEIEALVLSVLERVDGFVIDASGRLLMLAGPLILIAAAPADPS